jgi:putative spermidine/putrescine transport system permease protein
MKSVAHSAKHRLTNILAAATIVGLAGGPLVLLALWSLARAWYWPALLPREWSARAWLYIFAPESDVLSSLLVSIGIALAVTALSIVIALPAARAIALHEFAGKRALLFALLLPVLAPPLASAMGMHALFIRYGLADTALGVILVHLIPAAPYTTLMLAGSFSRFDPDYEAQARTLGASMFSVWRYVTVPAIAPGLAVAAAFAFIISWSQYLTTVLVGGGRVITLPLALVAFQRSGDEAMTAALSLVFLAPTLVVFAVVARFLRENE